MFGVRNKKTGISHNVYAVSENQAGDIYFLFYETKEERWVWHLASNYEPIK